jgi:hypothetical protein
VVKSRGPHGNSMEHGSRYMVIRRCSTYSFLDIPLSSHSSLNIFAKIVQFKLISLIYGGDFNIFRPKGVKRDHEEYALEVVKQQFRFFGPFPVKISEIASPEIVHAILWLMQEIPDEKLAQFYSITEREVIKKDKEFIGKFTKLDWRDRPTAKELLEDAWWKDDEE